MSETPARDVFYTGRDGLSLHVRDHGERTSPWLPVVCLPGLTRTHRDFEALARSLASDQERPRRIAAFDYRGRGRSGWDRDGAGYNPVRETDDILDGMASLGIARAVVIGTSRGGIIGMIMGLLKPASVAALILNDVGPELEARGLARIKAYVGATPLPDDWADAARIQKRLHGGAFPAWSEDDWLDFAHQTYAEADGRPVRDYDPILASTLSGIDFDRPIPTLWDEFHSLKGLPIMAIRGANSDLLSEATLVAMRDAHPGLVEVTVADEGHPPALRGADLLGRIAAFIAAAEGDGQPADAIVPRPAPEVSPGEER